VDVLISDRNIKYITAIAMFWWRFAKFIAAVDVVSLNIPLLAKSQRFS